MSTLVRLNGFAAWLPLLGAILFGAITWGVLSQRVTALEENATNINERQMQYEKDMRDMKGDVGRILGILEGRQQIHPQ